MMTAPLRYHDRGRRRAPMNRSPVETGDLPDLSSCHGDFLPVFWSPRFRQRPSVAAVVLQDLDLVAVGILDEEEPGHQRAVAVEFLDRLAVDPGSLRSALLGLEIVDHDREMAVAVTERVGRRAAVIDGQLDLEIGASGCADRPG